ncbi:hypothetical protein [Microbacterium sp. NPDC057650]|uniref:hypothetical protein n=1 Tax=unclassified Microbacterium TaxID=2609290 RepID=UPI00366D1A94
MDSEGGREAPAGSETDPPRSARAATRKRSLFTAAVAASALLIGLGAGWLLFGRDSGPAMTAAQQKAWAEFEASGKYDQGSIRVVGERYGITAWYATKNDLHLECIMLTPLPDDVAGCATPPDPKNEDQSFLGELSVNAPLDKPEGATVQAYLVRDTAGEYVAIIDRWVDAAQDWTTMFQGSELDIAKVIVKETGTDGNFLQIVGYDGDTPIWLSQGEKTCLYVADTEKVTTNVCDIDLNTGEKVLVEHPGAVYSVRMTNHGPVVTVIRNQGSGSDGPAIDDTTGKQTG